MIDLTNGLNYGLDDGIKNVLDKLHLVVPGVSSGKRYKFSRHEFDRGR